MDGVSHDYEQPRDLTYANEPFLDLQTRMDSDASSRTAALKSQAPL